MPPTIRRIPLTTSTFTRVLSSRSTLLRQPLFLGTTTIHPSKPTPSFRCTYATTTSPSPTPSSSDSAVETAQIESLIADLEKDLPKDPHHASSSHDSHDSHGDHGHGHESHYDPPGGWLWGVRPGEKYEREGWERIFHWFYVLPLVVAVGVYVQREDSSIQTWALEEARRRLEKEGILEDPFPEGVPDPATIDESRGE